MTKLLIVDDHAIVREGLKKALSTYGFDSIHEADSVASARAAIAQLNPQVVTIDINLGDGTGFELITWIRSISKEIAIIVLTLHDDSNSVLAAKRAGASAFVSKSEPIPQLLLAIQQSLLAPMSFNSQQIAQGFDEVFAQLTPREFDLIAALEKGMSTQQIAETLFITQATVKTHLASIYRKLEVTNRSAAVHIAKKRGLTS
jgi:DNA-binding NarL/FixJ family response regulator